MGKIGGTTFGSKGFFGKGEGLGDLEFKAVPSVVHDPRKYEALMTALRNRFANILEGDLARRLGVNLEKEFRIDEDGLVQGRLFETNSAFGVKFAPVLRIDRAVDKSGEYYYEVRMRDDALFGVNQFTKYFPFTESGRTIRAIHKLTRDTFQEFLDLQPRIVMDKRNLYDGVYDIVTAASAFSGGLAVFGYSWGLGAIGPGAFGAVTGTLLGVHHVLNVKVMD